MEKYTQTKLKFRVIENSELCEIKVSYINPVKPINRVKITCAKDTENILRSIITEGQIEHREQFVCLYIDRHNKVICYNIIGIGGINGTIADPRITFQGALKVNASSVIICHNHPSDNKEPSQSDEKLTIKYKNCGEFLDIQVLDHIILTINGYYSFADNHNII